MESLVTLPGRTILVAGDAPDLLYSKRTAVVSKKCQIYELAEFLVVTE